MNTTFKQVLHFIANAFEDSNGDTSIMRIMFAVMILDGLYIATYQVLNLPTHTFDNINLTNIIGLACGLKLWQKQQETNLDKTINK